MNPAHARPLLAGLLLGLLAACSAAPPPEPATSPTPLVPSTSSTPLAAPGQPTGSAGPAEPAEPTTTNTLPAPPDPTAPAPSTAGDLDAAALPVPAGWRTRALEGGDEEGFRGNGTWVHARDPRYAAQAVITIGCTEVTRDDYPDPTAALEGNYTGAGGAPGVGLVLDFANPADAERYWDRYTAQVQACTTLDDPVRTELVTVPDLPAGSDHALVDRRTYADGEWTEVARLSGRRVGLMILSDEGHRISPAECGRILAQLG